MSGRLRGGSSNRGPKTDFVAHVLDRRGRPREVDDRPSEVVERGLDVGSDVEHSTERVGRPRREQRAPHRVGDIGEAPSLAAVAVHGQGLPCERLAEEPRHHRPVAPGIESGAVRVEVPHDRDRQAHVARARERDARRAPSPSRTTSAPRRSSRAPGRRPRARAASATSRRPRTSRPAAPGGDDAHTHRARARCPGCWCAAIRAGRRRCDARRPPPRDGRPRRPPRPPCRRGRHRGSIPRRAGPGRRGSRRGPSPGCRAPSPLRPRRRAHRRRAIR